MFRSSDDIDDELFIDDEDEDDDDFGVDIEDDITDTVTSMAAPEEKSATTEKEDKAAANALKKAAKATRDFRKKYFSSITARRSSITYFGVGEEDHSLVMSNNSGAYFASVMASELGLQVVHFKQNWELITDLKQDLLLSDNKVYVAQVPTYLAQVNKYKLDNVRVWRTEDRKIVCTEKDKTDYDPKRQLVAYPASYHLSTSVEQWYRYTLGIGTPEHEQQVPHMWIDLDVDPILVGITSAITINLSALRRKDNTLIFDKHVPTLQPMLFDGVGTPSTKEFVRKGVDNTYRLYVWVEEDAYVRVMTIYEDEHVLIKSLKPNICFYPIPLAKLQKEHPSV